VTLAVAALVRGEGPREAGRARPIDGPDQGFTFFTAGIALQVAAAGGPFEESLRSVVSLGGDTDTNAAVTGALLGALHGLGGLPPAWLEKLVDRPAIEAEAEALAGAATVS
jgi:ADP-ribosylglycohydrolase